MLVLALCGCQAKTAQNAPAEQTYSAGSVYVADSPVECQTNGAVQTYGVSPQGSLELGYLDGYVLVFDTADKTRLCSLSGEDGSACGQVLLQDRLKSDDMRYFDGLLGYYSEAENSLVYFDPTLHRTGRLPLHAPRVTQAVLSEKMDTLFYCTDDQVRALDLKTGLSRLLKANSTQTVLDACGGLLLCRTETENGAYADFMSTGTGWTVYQDAGLLTFESHGGAYFLSRREGILCEYLFGTNQEDVRTFCPAEQDAECFWLPDMGCVLCVVCGEEAVTLSVYDLDSGLRTAAVAVPGLKTVSSAVGGNGAVWFVAGGVDGSAVYRWDTEKSKVRDPAVYISVRHTPQSPDTAGLEQCRVRAAALSEDYHVEIAFDLLACPEGEAVVQEYQPAAIQIGLNRLGGALERFPEGFFQLLGGTLHIQLVRTLPKDLPMFWRNGEPYITLAIGEGMKDRLYRQLYHVLDNVIIGKSPLLDDWQALNPRDFSYDYHYWAYEDRTDSPYLTGENRAFVDAYSMTFPREDRAAIFACAMADGNSALFATERMQRKLRQLCDAIRDACGEFPQPPVWEQYLNPPAA